MGDARGHLSRALAIARELPQHEFLFIGGSKAHILEESGYRVKNVPILPMVIRNNQVNFAATLARGLIGLGHMGPAFKEVRALIKDFDPHLIISD